MKKFALLVLLISAITACVGAVTLEQRTEYSRKGTRSESRHGFLYASGQAVPECFEFVQQGSQAWEFFSRKNLWGDDGYHASHKRVTNEISTKSISDAVQNRGWYAGSVMLKDTPKDWLFVRWGTNTSWIAPSALSDWAAAHKAPTLIRFSRQDMFRQ
jgi:hypothetical protein